MSLVKTWYEPAAAADKFGISEKLIVQWVEDGLVRCEREGDTIRRVNIDDVKLEVEALVRES